MKNLLHNRILRRLGALAGVSAIVVGAIVIYAALTDQEQIPDNSITTGAAADLGLSLSSGWIVFENVTPGDPALGAQPLTVTNLGPDPIHYSMSITITELDGLGLSAHVIAALQADSGAGDCLVGTSLKTGGLPTMELGDPAPGIQAGDRSLAVGASEVLCLNVTVEATAPPGAASDFVFTFDAEKD